MIKKIFLLFLSFNTLFLLNAQSPKSTYSIKSKGVTFKVQIGAFSKTKPEVFTDIPDLSTYVLPNGMTKYLSGEFPSYEEALLHKKQLVEKGYEGTFVIAFKSGALIPISSLHIVVNHDLVNLINDAKPNNSNSKKAKEINSLSLNSNITDETINIKLDEEFIPANEVFYRVKIGEFKGGVPLETMEKFNQLSDLIYIYKTDDGFFTYSTGYYNSNQDASTAKEKLKELGLSETSIIGIYKGQILTNDTMNRIKSRI